MSSPYTVSRYLRRPGADLALPRPPQWTELALCPEADPDLFYPEGQGASAGPARAVCRGCEARLPCLEYALETGQALGVWGGFSERARRLVAAEHEAGRSLEDIIAADDAAYYERAERAARLAAARQARMRERQAATRATAAAILADRSPQPREVAAA